MVQQKENLIRLNKYIADAGVCSRREADELISSGQIKVNKRVTTELGTKVSPEDEVIYRGRVLEPKRDYDYVVLNKPKDYITTTRDERGRKTVMDLVGRASRNRIYPVGRLDRTTTGILLLTNDGDLANTLMHPSSKVEKVYRVELDKDVTEEDSKKLLQGVELEDGLAMVDEVAYVDPPRKREVGLSLHSGKNRIIRRLFEALGYEVVKLDRTSFAGLTKKSMERGQWRRLHPREVRNLKRSCGLLGKKR